MKTPAQLTESPVEHAARLRARYEIEAIAHDLQRPVGEVAELYMRIYAALRPRALVVDFLPLLVARKVRLCFQRQHNALLPDAPAPSQH